MWNRKGQVIGYTIMLVIVITVLALALAGPLQEVVNDARSPTVGDTLGLDCGNTSIHKDIRT